MNNIEREERRSMNRVLIIGAIIVAILIAGVFAFNYYWERPIEETDDVICGVLPVDQQGACCAERHQNDTIPACVGTWVYSLAADGCTYMCSSGDSNLTP